MAKNTERLSRRLRRMLLPPLIAWVGQGLLHLIMMTCRVRIEGKEHLIQTADEGRTILMLWHNRIAIITNILFRTARQYYYAAVVSNSRDGRLVAAIAETWDHGRAIKVRHDARHSAVKETLKALEQNVIVLITPDGPRGPLYTVKKGVAFLAREARASIIPLTWNATRYWKLPTWDETRIPKPFSTIHVRFGAPIRIPDEETSLEDSSKRLAVALKNL